MAETCLADCVHAILKVLKRRIKKQIKQGPDSAQRRPVGGKISPQTLPIRKWLFRCLAAIVVPLITITILEIGLRLGGYGYSTGFFKPMRIGNQDILVENDSFGFRFFPPDIARMPSAIRMSAHKAPGTYRIFILGESAALGDPEPAFGAGRYLEVLLRERFPTQKFEVVNVAMTAINSHAILPIARDCARQEGDLWILYMGNNEMVGPFGAVTVFGAQAPPWPWVRLNLALQNWRLGQLLEEMGRKIRGKAPDGGPWSGMKMFEGNLISPEDPRKSVVYSNFQRNLRDILRVGLDSGAHILLSTVAVNQKDCPPFGSLISSNLSTGDREQVAQLLSQGNTLAAQGNDAGAATRYEQAGRFNPQSADLEFRWGSCLLDSTNLSAARVHFQRAVDFDCLPFRADSRINDLIVETGRQLVSPSLSLLDSSAVLAASLADGLPGQEEFYEHVHLNFDGNYRLALAWAERVASLLPSSINERASGTWASQEICEQRLALTDWDRRNVLEEVCRRLKQPPLSGQYHNEQRLHSFTEQVVQLKKRMDSGEVQRARETYVEGLKGAPDDFYLLENYAYFLVDQGDIEGASQQWQKVRDLIPQDIASYYELGRLATRQGKFEEAETFLGQAVAIHESFAPGWFELGKAFAASGNYEKSLQAFDRALKFEPQDAQTWFYSGLELARLGRRAEAIEHYRQAVQFDPDNWKAHYELGGLFGLDGKMSDARSESEMAVRLNPNFPSARLNLGMALVQLGRMEEAQQQFEEILRLDPTNSKAADYLQQVKNLKNHKP